MQLVLPNGINWNLVSFSFVVPTIGTASSVVQPSMNQSGVILWTLGSSGASLFASGETNVFKYIDVNTVATGSI